MIKYIFIENYYLKNLNYMKKTLIFLLVFVVYLPIFATVTYSGTCGEHISWNLNQEDSILTISGFGTMTNYDRNSPPTNPSPWTNRSDIKTIIISDSITNVGHCSFSKCANLESVQLGDSITEIGCEAFVQCSKLKVINIPMSVRYIDMSAFGSCISLENIELHDSIIVLGSLAFSGCSALNQIHFPIKVNTINTGTFGGCVKFTEMPMGENVTSIGYGAFKGCLGFTQVVIPEHVTSIDAYAFYGCRNLTSVTLHDSITTIGGEAFRYCEKLESFIMPEKEDTISGYLFVGCSSMTKLTIGKNTKYIGRAAIADCYKLRDITCHAAVPPALHVDAFINFSRFYTTLRVPIRSVSVYSTTDVWKDFIILGYCNVQVSPNDESMGYVTGQQGEMSQYSNISLYANAKSGYKFVQWSDGNTENPRSIYVTDDVNMTAIFAPMDATGIDDIMSKSCRDKILIDGVLYILRGDKTYTLQGQEVR